MVSINASLPFAMASSLEAPSEMHTSKSGYEMKEPPPSSSESISILGLAVAVLR
jgi:hypothetical protein